MPACFNNKHIQTKQSVHYAKRFSLVTETDRLRKTEFVGHRDVAGHWVQVMEWWAVRYILMLFEMDQTFMPVVSHLPECSLIRRLYHCLFLVICLFHTQQINRSKRLKTPILKYAFCLTYTVHNLYRTNISAMYSFE